MLLLTVSAMLSSLPCLLFFLPFFSVICIVNFSQCPLFSKSSVYRDGDLILGGFFPIYSENFQSELKKLHWLFKQIQIPHNLWTWNHYEYVLAFLYAIEEVNKDPYLLPNLTLGFNIYNSKSKRGDALKNTLLWFSGVNQTVPNYNCEKKRKSIGIITGNEAQLSPTIASLLELYKIPQVTYTAFNSLLSDKDQFPSLYQMATKDNSLVHGVMWLLLHFEWTYVGLLLSENIKNEQFHSALKREMVKKRMCLVFKLILPSLDMKTSKLNIRLGVSLGSPKVNITIAYGHSEIFMEIYIMSRNSELSGMMWIMATESYIDLKTMKGIMGVFYGSLSFLPPKRDIPGFKHFIKTVNPSIYPEDFYLSTFWVETFNCSLSVSLCGKVKNCPPNTSLEFIPGDIDMLIMSEPSYLIYNAVHAVTRALHEMLLEETQIELTGDVNTAVVFYGQLHSFLRNIRFTNSIGDPVSLDDQRNSKRLYDIMNILPFPENNDFLLKVGEFVYNDSNNQNMSITEETIEWPVHLEKIPQSSCGQRCGLGFKKSLLGDIMNICCFECVFCLDGEISNQKGAESCIQCSDVEYSNQQRTHCLLKSVTYLDFEDYFGMALTCMILCFTLLTTGVLWIFVKNQDTPIVKANNRTLSYILLISLLLCFLCSFLFIGHPNIVTCVLQQVTFAVVFTVAVSTVLAKTITVILAFKAMIPGRTGRWLLVSGAANYVIPICTMIQVIICGLWLGLSPPFVDLDTHSEPRHIIILCNKGSVTAFYCVLGYLGSLALVSFSLSYLVRNLPDTFNEAKFLTFSMLVFCSIWVTFLPVYHSARGKVMVILEIFSILASSAGLLVCIFAPKCYIILIRPDKNSLENIKKKIGPRRKIHS